MGQRQSQLVFDVRGGRDGRKAKNKGKVDSLSVLVTLPYVAQRYLTAKTIESAATSFEQVASGVEHIGDTYNNYQNGRTYRRELQANGTAFREQLLAVHASPSSVSKFLGNANWMQLFALFLNSVEIATIVLQIMSGRSELEKIGLKIAEQLEANTGLKAPKKFSEHVYDYLWMHHYNNAATRDGRKHFLFLYHPDTNWHAPFAAFVRRGAALPSSLLGMSENLDALVLWMMFFRQHARNSKGSQKAVFHILIPSYRTWVISDPEYYCLRRLATDD